MNEYYDKCYRIPRGEALKTFEVPEGIITNLPSIKQSALIEDLLELGRDYCRNDSVPMKSWPVKKIKK